MRKRVSQKPFIEAPFMIIWELLSPPITDWGFSPDKTVPGTSQKKLTLEEKKNVVDQIRELGEIKLVFIGRSLFAEKDFFELVTYATQVGLTVAVQPSLTSVITSSCLIELQRAGAEVLSIDLHAPNQKNHDAINGPGSFDIARETIENVIGVGMSLQINTALSTVTYPYIKQLAEEIKNYPLALWNIVLTLENESELPSASESELLYQWLYDFSKEAPFDLKTTSGQQFHRVIIQNKRRENKVSGNYIHYRDALLNGLAGVKGGIERAPYGINDGKGMLFISHYNDIYPSSMLPIKIGNVLEDNLADVYRNSPILKKIQNTERLKGKCGLCEFRHICGGSRARAYLLTGDYLAADPRCLYKTSELYKEK